jgi:hypothetical protein
MARQAMSLAGDHRAALRKKRRPAGRRRTGPSRYRCSPDRKPARFQALGTPATVSSPTVLGHNNIMTAALLDLAARVGHRDLRNYLAARGWTNIPSRRDYAAIYRSPADGNVDVQIPLDTNLADYTEAILFAARRIADFEDRSAEHVLRGLLERLEPLAQQLRPARESEPGRFVGKVIELSGAPNSAGELEGDVVLQVQTDEQLLKVRVTLDPDAYRDAGVAHLQQRYVSVRGHLHRGTRTSVLRQPSELVVLPP